MKLTESQEKVLAAMRIVARYNVFQYVEKYPYLFQEECRKLVKGDGYCVFGSGVLSWQVSPQVGLKASQVLLIFKQLQRKGLVIKESGVRPTHGRPLYWWPVGFASQLCAELADAGL